jgi:polar amino acid transport system substrate-binding protein
VRFASALTLGLAAAFGLSGCDLPRDPRGTLEETIGDTLYVGVSEASPWVVRNGARPAGVEPELIRRFARSIGAEVRWSWGSAEEHMEALSSYELDVAIGGFTRATPWRKHVGLTQPYHTTRIIVAGPAGAPPVGEGEIENRPVAVPAGGPIGSYVRHEGGEPVPADHLAGTTGLVAAPDWELVRMGRDTLGFTLARHHHVMAVPPGENALLMALEDALHGADVEGLLQSTGGAAP